MLDDFIDHFLLYCAISAYLFVLLSFCRFLYSCLRPSRRPAVYYQHHNLMFLKNIQIINTNTNSLHVNQQPTDADVQLYEGEESVQLSMTGKFDEGQCAICLSVPQVDVTFPPCGHAFCFECIIHWCKIKEECPICKQEIFFLSHNIGYDDLNSAEQRVIIRSHHIGRERLESIFMRQCIIDLANERDILLAQQRLMWPSPECLENCTKIWVLDFKIKMVMRAFTTGKSLLQVINEN